MDMYGQVTGKLQEVGRGELDLPEFYVFFWQKIVYMKLGQCLELVESAAAFNHLDPKAPAWNMVARGQSYTFGGDFINGANVLHEAVEQFTAFGDNGGLLASECLLSLCYRSLGRLDKAQSHMQRALNLLSDELNESMYAFFQPITCYQSGELCFQFKNYEEAIVNYKKGLSFSSAKPEIRGRLNGALGVVYMNLAEWDKAIFHYEECRKIIADLNNHVLDSKLFGDISVYYSLKGELQSALEYQLKSLKIRTDNNLVNPAISNYILLAELYDKIGDRDTAIKYGELAVEQAGKINVVIKLYEAHRILARIYEASGDVEKAFHHFKQYHKFREEVHSQDVMRKVEQISGQHKLETMQQEKEIFRLRNVELKSALDEITESFRYAKRIQTAILPPDNFFRSCFDEGFILYKPKDIVSGDFYWMEKTEDSMIIAACDCTGHGVPGAMVSVVCHNALNRSVREFQKRVPADILDKACEIVISEFEKSDDDVKDGMDIVLCSIHKNKLQYAGANNPLWIVRDGQLIEIKGTKRPIGKHIENTKFVNNEFELQKGDVLYLFSDGYADQFGGPQGKKFKYKQLEELLLAGYNLPMEEQKSILHKRFEDWKGRLEQIDDVLVIGVRI